MKGTSKSVEPAVSSNSLLTSCVYIKRVVKAGQTIKRIGGQGGKVGPQVGRRTRGGEEEGQEAEPHPLQVRDRVQPGGLRLHAPREEATYLNEERIAPSSGRPQMWTCGTW